MKDGTLTESGLGSKLDAAFCAAYACGSIFYISTISPEGPTLHRISRTGTEEKTVPLSGLSLWVNAMAYSYADDAMYAIGKARGISENVLAEIDLETGVVTQVCTFADPDAALSTNGFVLAMAIDLAGRIHIMDFSNGTTDLYRLDPAAGTYTRIGTTGIPWKLTRRLPKPRCAPYFRTVRRFTVCPPCLMNRLPRKSPLTFKRILARSPLR